MAMTGQPVSWDPTLGEDDLFQPLLCVQARRIAVVDLFDESIPDDLIDKAMAVMALAPYHTFTITTARSERMREYMTQSRAASLFVLGEARRGLHVTPL
jgi:protein gp37